MDFDDPFAAAHCFSAAASIDPDELINRLNLAMALIDAGQIETAHDILEQAVLDHPCNPALLDILADAKRRIADWYPQQRYAILADSRALEETVAEINADHQLAESRLAGDAMSGDAAGMIGP
jgi:predicted Zn-dependent protease